MNYIVKIALEGMLGIYTNDSNNEFVGLLPSKAIWLKESDIIPESDITFRPIYGRYEPHNYRYTEISMQCPCCNNYVFSANFKG